MNRAANGPRDSPAWAQDRARLWNAVEAAERRKDAQVAREVRVAIPRELRHEDGRALVRDYAQRAFVDRGMVADLAYHGGQGENPHAHIMLTTRSISPEGFGQKDRSWNTKALLKSWREDWAATANRALKRRGHSERIDHRTLAAQRDEALQRGDTARAETLDRDPEIHLGRTAWMMARTDEDNARTERNARIAAVRHHVRRSLEVTKPDDAPAHQHSEHEWDARDDREAGDQEDRLNSSH